MDPALQRLLEGDREDEIEAIVKLRDPGRIPPDLRIVARFGKVVTGRLMRGSIGRIWADPRVDSVKAPRLLEFAEDSRSSLVDKTRSNDYRRPPGLTETGRGVVLGVIDWGLDVGCEAFRRSDGSTRLLALWDQRGSARGAIARRYGYGRVLTRPMIDAALASDRPYAQLDYHPAESDPFGNGAHGTHVLHIAGGGDRRGGLEGVAPGADLVFVHLAAGRLGGLADLGDSVRILEALDFMRRVAQGRPLVINGSLGRHGGAHRGCSLLEQGIDAFVSEAPGRAVILSTGNYLSSGTHASGWLTSGRARTLKWLVFPTDTTENELEIWYPNRDRFRLALVAPDGERIEAALGESRTILSAGREVGRLYHRAFDPNVPDHHIDIFLDRAAPSGEWRVELLGEEVVDGRYDAWIERDVARRGAQSRFASADRERSGTTGSICNGFLNIAVGAVDFSGGRVRLTPFSSSGPTRDGRQKPDLVAPGLNVLAARSTPRGAESPACTLVRKSGASQAAPHVAGAVALMLEAAGRPLAIHETRRLLFANTIELQLPEPAGHRIGAGMLDISAAVVAARAVAPQGDDDTADHREMEGGMTNQDTTTQSEPAETFEESARFESAVDESLGEASDTTGPALARAALGEAAIAAGSATGLSSVIGAWLFDAIAFDDASPDRIGELFDVVSRPMEQIAGPLRPGDIVIERALVQGDLATVAVIEVATPAADLEQSSARLVLRPRGPAFSEGTGGEATFPDEEVVGPSSEVARPEGDAETPVAIAIALASLGLAAFEALKPYALGGSFKVRSTSARYVHANTPAGLKTYERIVTFGIRAHHPRYFIGGQNFFFVLRFTYNGVDVLNATVRADVGASSTLVSSTFSITFDPQMKSPQSEPVAVMVFNITGDWNPVGRGRESFGGRLTVHASGKVGFQLRARRWIRRHPMGGLGPLWVRGGGGPIVRLRRLQQRTSRTRVYFKVASHRLESGETRSISAWYQTLPSAVRREIEAGRIEIRVEGHASTTGSVERNQNLSRRRAQRVAGLLRDLAGSNARFMIRVLGELRAGTADERENREERRVEIRISYAA